MINKALILLCNKEGGDEWFTMALKIAITFILGGIILSALSKAFNIDIMPSVIAQIKDLLTW